MTKSQPMLEAEVIAAALGGPRTPPVDLLAIADELNVNDIRYIHGASLEGATYFQADGPVIYLGRLAANINRHEAIHTMWFTLAHELAHVMLRRPGVVHLMARRGAPRLSKESEERLADRIAETLLIPDDWVKTISVSDATLEGLENVADLAGVSMAMLVSRLAAAGKDISLLQWQRGKHSWYVTDRPGTPRCLHGNIRLSESSVMTLDNTDSSERVIVADAYMGQYRIIMLGLGRRQGDYVIQLIRPSRDIWMAKQRSSQESEPGSRPVIPGRDHTPAGRAASCGSARPEWST
jgi:hypothetical protein